MVAMHNVCHIQKGSTAGCKTTESKCSILSLYCINQLAADGKAVENWLGVTMTHVFLL